jgi:hypothetical protein
MIVSKQRLFENNKTIKNNQLIALPQEKKCPPYGGHGKVTGRMSGGM